MSRPATLLFVCHANICRSPMAERLTRQWLARLPMPAGAIAVHSAGTHARAGEPMHPGAAAALRRAGADTTGFASRPLTTRLLDEAGLVLTATRQQRAACVTLSPAVLVRAFTIRQLGRLAAALPGSWPDLRLPPATPAQRLAQLAEAVTRVRGDAQPGSSAEDDLADPVNGTAEDIWACLGQLQTALRPVLALIAS